MYVSAHHIISVHYTLTDDDNALPVELVSFNANCNDGVVDLLWETASENNR